MLLLLNAAALFYIFHLENREDPRRALQRSNPLVLPAAGDIVGLRVNSLGEDGQQKTRTLEKDRRGWRLTAPVKWPANENAVQKILTQLQFLERETRIPISDIEKSGQTLADFGLDPARFELTLTSVEDTETRLEIGSPTQMGQRLYVMAPSGEEVLVVSNDLLSAIAVPLSELRSQRIFDIPVFELQNLTIQNDAQRIRLAKGPGGWAFETPVPAKADDQLVQNALALIVGQRVVKLLEPGAVTPELTGLATPNFRVTLGGSSMRQTLLLGGDVPNLPDNAPRQLYARLENGADDSTIFTVLAAPFERLTRAQEELRERKILRFDPAEVTSMEIDRAGKALTLQKLEASNADEPPAWQSVSTSSSGEVRTEAASAVLVEQLIDRLTRLQAVAFVSDAPAPSDLTQWGLTDPVAQITVRGPEPLTLKIGNNIQSSSDANPPPWANPRNIYAQIEGKPSVYAVDLSILSALRVDPLAYRSRTLTRLPKGARVRSIKLIDLQGDRVLLEKSIDPAAETWPTALAPDNEDRAEILTVIDTLKEFRVKGYLLPVFEELPNLPWRYRLEAEIILPGGDGSVENRSYSFTLRDGVRQVGGSPQQNVTFLLTQDLIDALFPLSLERNPPHVPRSVEEVEEAPVDAGAPRSAGPQGESSP